MYIFHNLGEITLVFSRIKFYCSLCQVLVAFYNTLEKLQAMKETHVTLPFHSKIEASAKSSMPEQTRSSFRSVTELP